MNEIGVESSSLSSLAFQTHIRNFFVQSQNKEKFYSIISENICVM